MATATRRTSIANPARKRKRKNPRKLSAKQIKAGFGGKRRKSSLKNSGHRKRTKPVRAARRAPKQKKNSAHSHRQGFFRSKPRAKKRTGVKRRRKNSPTEIVHYTLGSATRNPARKGKMAATKRRKTRAAHRSNGKRRSRRNGRVRQNPFGGSFGQEITSAIFALGGFVASKLGAQAALGGSNTGPMGYAANLGIGIAGAWIIGGPMKNKKGAASFLTGSVIEVIARLIQDMTPFGSYVSGIAGVGDAGCAGFGAYFPSNWVSPQRYVNAARSAQVQIPQGWGGAPLAIQSAAPPPAMAAAASGVGSLYGRAGASSSLY
jgi:hypothetical protein